MTCLLYCFNLKFNYRRIGFFNISSHDTVRLFPPQYLVSLTGAHLQVFMTALVGGQCLGLALPSVATVNSGRGAAYGVYAMIDRVSNSF